MRRFGNITVSANVLPTAIVITLIMTLSVLVILSLWEMESQLLTRNNYIKSQRANVRSALILYKNHPEIYDENGINTIMLYDSIPASEVTLKRRSWGLYEIVSAESTNAGIRNAAIVGLAPDNNRTGLYYADKGNTLTITGNTNLHGVLHIPVSGIIYGQIRSEFFSGEKPLPNNTKVSEKNIPQASSGIKTMLEQMFNLLDKEHEPMAADSLNCSFYDENTIVLSAENTVLSGSCLTGNIILVANNVRIDSTCTFNDILVVGRRITVGEGFRGSAQMFARDSLVLEDRVCLDYPSGVYSGQYAELSDDAEVNGYVIVCAGDAADVRNPNYRQSRQSCVRGIVYVDGNAQLQGIVSGTAYLTRAVYCSNDGYYKDMLYDVSVLENRRMATPFLFSSNGKRNHIKWVQ